MNPFGGVWGWMYWNLTLAAVPLALSLVLFRRSACTTVMWWMGLAAFIFFLPNAPYVLTDAVHLRNDLAHAGSTNLVFLRYGFLFSAGVTAYVVSIWRGIRFLIARGAARWIEIPVAACLCAICSLGVYVGREHRFNSWDIVRAPDDVLQAAVSGLTHPPALRWMAFLFWILVVASVVGMALLDVVVSRLRRNAA